MALRKGEDGAGCSRERVVAGSWWRGVKRERENEWEKEGVKKKE